MPMGDGYRHKATINVNNESVILGTFDSPKEVAHFRVSSHIQPIL